VAAPVDCSSVRSGWVGRGAGRQNSQTAREGREAGVVRQTPKPVVHNRPAPLPATGCPSRHAWARSRGTGRRGSHRCCKVAGCCRDGRRRVGTERRVLYRCLRSWRRRLGQHKRWNMVQRARASAARAPITVQGKREERAKSARSASSYTQTFAKNTSNAGGWPLPLAAPFATPLRNFILSKF